MRRFCSFTTLYQISKKKSALSWSPQASPNVKIQIFKVESDSVSAVKILAGENVCTHDRRTYVTLVE
jgi:hypothetical protein